MTPETVGTGWGLVVGGVLILAGLVVVALFRWSRREPVHRCPGCDFAARLDALVAEDESRVWAAVHVDQALRLVAPSNVVPMQRRAGDGS